MSDQRAKRLAQWARYNASAKGRQRDQRYEAKHPERKVRWSPITGREVANQTGLDHPDQSQSNSVSQANDRGPIA